MIPDLYEALSTNSMISDNVAEQEIELMRSIDQTGIHSIRQT